MRTLLLLSAIFSVLTANAQNYLITFTGSGAATNINSVKVDNLTAGTSLTLNGSDILRLTGTVGINEVENEKSSDIVIYPNPMVEYSILQIYPPVAGNAVISILDMTGKLIAQLTDYMDNNLQDYHLSGINHGSYIINVKGSNFHYSAKLICIGQAGGNIRIDKMINDQANSDKSLKTSSKGELATVDMNYTIGDRLKFTGISGIYSTVKTDVPEGSKTITFNFIACTDGDGINYSTVDIGGQVWMAENLKTTKYNDGTAIPNITVAGTWAATTTGAYCDYNNIPANSTTFGRLYNWYAVDNNAATKVASNGGKNVCPTGWRVPSDAEWTTLTTYLTNSGYGYEGSGDDIAKSIASTSGWTTFANLGTVGNDQTSNNSSGFTVLPSGYRHYHGTFDFFGKSSYWWSSSDYSTTQAYNRGVYYVNSYIGRYGNIKQGGFSVRCLKD